MSTTRDKEVDQLGARLRQLLERHKTTVYKVADHSTNIFEAFCFTVLCTYYENSGYVLTPRNLLEGRFRFKYSTNGYPWNFSFFEARAVSTAAKNAPVLFEIRHNQKVAGAYSKLGNGGSDPPLFAVDVAVIKHGCVPDLKPGRKPADDEKGWIDNAGLITFAEVKKLTAYPMLIAQFLGIVHEVKPDFILPTKRASLETILSAHHPPPLLFTSNFLTAGTQKVLESLDERRLLVRVVKDVTGSSESILLRRIAGEDE